MAPEPPGGDPVSGTVDVLVKSLRALGQAGRPDAANRLAARAWWLLKEAHPREAERVNGAMHFLARLPAEPGAPATAAPASTNTAAPTPAAPTPAAPTKE
ncbi:MAG TPA: hypothetical protein VFL69_04055 [Marmoricola sp.]|nr:hypothetical protein [Marmoricola sp.]